MSYNTNKNHHHHHHDAGSTSTLQSSQLTTVRVGQVKSMNAEQCHMAADIHSQPTNTGRDSAYRLLPFTPTIIQA